VITRERSRSRLEVCLRSLAGQSPATHEVIVVQAGGGLAAQRNAAAQAAVGDVLAFLAGDALAHPGWVGALAEAFRDGAAVAAGAIVEADGRGGASRGHDLHGLRDFLPSASAVNLAIRRDLFENLGGFDPAVEGAEDRDLSFRAQLAGHGLTEVKRAAVSLPRRTDLPAQLRAARAQPALRRKYDHFVFHDALRSWHRPMVRVPGEALGWVELLAGRRPVPAFEEPSTSDQELEARPLPRLPSLVLVASRPADADAARARARRTRELAIPPPGLLEEMLPRWDEPAPWAMRAARLASRHGWPLPALLIAKRLERERVSSWGDACLALHGIYAWAHGKERYGLVISPSSSAALMSRIPELGSRTIAGTEAVWTHERAA
jgi:hypothetical protein